METGRLPVLYTLFGYAFPSLRGVDFDRFRAIKGHLFWRLVLFWSYFQKLGRFFDNLKNSLFGQNRRENDGYVVDRR